MGKRNGYFGGFLTRLARNQAGNTLAIVAAALIPLLGLVGGGIDMSRLYLTKARLQQACDAGALAGRKQMGSGAWSASSNKANTVALQLFDANFTSGAYGTGARTRSFSESAGKVTGVAAAPVPMTIMRIFGQDTKLVSVTCDAEMRIPNTDVMFVLDTTGSMSYTNTGDTQNKITGLKNAVKCFYEALMKVDTTADCGSTPSGGNGASVQLRFGFVPYSVNVNVGKLLNNDWIANSANYQTRVAQFTNQNVQSGWNTGSATVYSTNQVTTSNWMQSQTTTNNVNSCNGLEPSDGITFTGDEYGNYNASNWQDGNNRVYQWTTRQNGAYHQYNSSYDSKNHRCTVTDTYINGYQERTYRRTDTPVYTQQPVFSQWNYQQAALDVSGLKAGDSNWNSSVSLPLGSSGTNTNVSWDGCIEERKTVRASSYSPIPADAWDLDIDMIPSTSDPDSQWKPLLANAVWGRYTNSGNTTSTVSTANDLSRNRNYYCPTESRKLQTYPTAAPFESYVNSLTPNGNTYHDIGLIWGARLMSPTGLFATENAFTPNGGQIERHLIFMTDGDTVTNAEDYSAYGVAWWDRRTTTSTSSSQTGDQVNKRFLAMCSAIKNRNITLWVISFGDGVSGTAQTNLQNCASSGRFYAASNSQQLIDQFKAIADEISQLRLTN